MQPDRIRVVLDESVGEPQLITLAGEHNWWAHARHARDGAQPEEYVYRTSDGRSFLHWIEDHILSAKYILVKGPDASDIVEILRDRLASFSPEYIMHRAHKSSLSTSERREALYHLALQKTEHGFDQETFDIYCKAMRDPDPYVRGSAVQGAAYLKWPELAGPLSPLASANEPDADIRKDATGLLALLKAGAP